MITLDIDGKKVEAKPGTMVIQAAEEAGIWIPRFCYHEKLTIAANCRMCLVEIEKAPKTLPACATPIAEGMKVMTRSAKARDAQKAVMEFLLINHPLDCPICDQGGECELQDLATGYGSGVSHFDEGKRAVFDEDLGPLVATEMTRCIQCTRCVRFGSDIAGIRELGALGRGENMHIATAVKHTLEFEMSGNIIDVCPVGALTSKPYRFTARAWELTQRPSIAAHDCVGSAIAVHTRDHTVMRVVPRRNDAVNEMWISDRDRFAYEGLHHTDRLLRPMLKQAGQWKEVEWSTALNAVTEGLRTVSEKFGGTEIGALASAQSTTEELFLLQKWVRHLGSPHIDHRLREIDVSDQTTQALAPALNIALSEMAERDLIFTIGAHVKQEQPILNHRIRQAVLRGGKVIHLHAIDYDYNYPADKIIVSPTQFVTTLSGIVKALLCLQKQTIPALLKSIDVTAQHETIAQQLKNAKKPLVLLGVFAEQHPEAATLRSFGEWIATLLAAPCGRATFGANAAGAWLAGCVPHRGPMGSAASHIGLSAQEQLQKALKAYILFNVEPHADLAHAYQAIKTLKEASFIVAMSSFQNDALFAVADVILPIAQPMETAGTYVNAAGLWQSFNAAVHPKGEVRPGWQVLSALLQLCNSDGPTSSEAICFELKTQAQHAKSPYTWRLPDAITVDAKPQLVFETPMYRCDALVRHAKALSQLVKPMALHLSSAFAKAQSLQAGESVMITQGEFNLSLPIVIDERIADHTVFIHGDSALGQGTIHIVKRG